MSETLTQPLVVPVRQGGSFARRPHEKGNVSIRNCVEGRIDRSGERRVPEPPQEPRSKLQPVEPQRCLQARLLLPLSPVLTPCETQDGTDTHAQITTGDGAHAANRSCFASISAARSKSTSARCRGQRRSDRSKGRAWSWLGSRTRWLSSVWLEPRAQGRLARPWVPARALEEGLVLSKKGLLSHRAT